MRGKNGGGRNMNGGPGWNEHEHKQEGRKECK